MKKDEIYENLTLLDGTEVKVMICRGWHIARANAKMFEYNKVEGNEEIDVSVFVAAQICEFNLHKKEVEFILDLLSDDYLAIMTSIGQLLTKLT